MSENLLYEWQQFREQIDYAHHVLDCNEAPIHPDADGTCKLTVGGRITALITSKEQRIAALTQQLADLTADRDSEHQWAEEYHRKWQAAEKERDSAQALLRDAVGVLKPFNTEIHESITNNSLHVYLQFAAGGVLSKVTVGQLRRARAFLSRPDVKAMGGGK